MQVIKCPICERPLIPCWIDKETSTLKETMPIIPRGYTEAFARCEECKETHLVCMTIEVLTLPRAKQKKT